MHTLLIVDDESDICFVLEKRLSRLGYNVLTAENTQAGLDFLNSNSIDLLICDFNLPDGGAVAITEQMAANCPPLICISGEDVDRSQFSNEINFVGFVEKPINANNLFDLIKDTLN